MKKNKTKAVTWFLVYALSLIAYVVTVCCWPIDIPRAHARNVSSIVGKCENPDYKITREDVVQLGAETKLLTLGIMIVSDVHNVANLLASSLIVFLSLTIVMQQLHLSRVERSMKI